MKNTYVGGSSLFSAMLFQLISLQSFSVGAFWHGRVWPPDDCFVCVCVSGLNGILPDKLEASKADAFDWVY